MVNFMYSLPHTKERTYSKNPELPKIKDTQIPNLVVFLAGVFYDLKVAK